MPNWAEVTITWLWTVAFVCSLYVWLPQFIIFLVLHNRDGLNIIRFKDFMSIGIIVFGTGWRVLVFVDYHYYNQEVFGPLDQRWPMELFIAGGIAASSICVAVVYHITRYHKEKV